MWVGGKAWEVQGQGHGSLALAPCSPSPRPPSLTRKAPDSAAPSHASSSQPPATPRSRDSGRDSSDGRSSSSAVAGQLARARAASAYRQASALLARTWVGRCGMGVGLGVGMHVVGRGLWPALYTFTSWVPEASRGEETMLGHGAEGRGEKGGTRGTLQMFLRVKRAHRRPCQDEGVHRMHACAHGFSRIRQPAWPTRPPPPVWRPGGRPPCRPPPPAGPCAPPRA